MLARKHLRKVKNYQPGKPIEEVKRELKLRRVSKLASNESPFSIPPSVRTALIKKLGDINRYPDGSSYYLRRALARRNRMRPDTIVLGNGSDELVVMALRAFCEPGDEVIVGFPTFLIYEIQATACGLKVRRSRFNGFRYDLADIRRKVTKKTKIIFIANPDNPNGTYLNAREIKDFLKKIPKRVIVFLDEAYAEFAPKDFPKSLGYVRKGRNLIVTRTFSKAYSLAGLRIGYGFASPQLARAMEKVREPFNVNILAQEAALAALKSPAYMRRLVRFTKAEKKYFYGALDRLRLSYVKSATNFILIDLKKRSAKRVFQALLKKGMIVREMSAWGLKNFIRVSVGTRSENRAFIKALQQVL